MSKIIRKFSEPFEIEEKSIQFLIRFAKKIENITRVMQDAYAFSGHEGLKEALDKNVAFNKTIDKRIDALKAQKVYYYP